jgi:4-alpha-methyl-delta7-sterol-4alpha-methyl oxidase
MEGASKALSELLALYMDERFFLIGICSTVLSITAFLVFAVPWTWVAWKNPEPLRKYRIQGKDIPVKRWLGPSLRAFTLNNLVSFAALLLSWPLASKSGLHIGWDVMPPWYVVVGQVVFFIILDDFLYYWMHRTLHRPWLYKHIHAVHHRVTNPCAINGNYMHVGEFILTSTLVFIGPVLVGAHVVTLWAWIVFRQLEAADGHSGYDVPWNPALLFPFYKGPVYHDFHHRRFFGNYAGFFAYLDGIFGEHSQGYREYRRRTSDEVEPEAVPVQGAGSSGGAA